MILMLSQFHYPTAAMDKLLTDLNLEPGMGRAAPWVNQGNCSVPTRSVQKFGVTTPPCSLSGSKIFVLMETDVPRINIFSRRT